MPVETLVVVGTDAMVGAVMVGDDAMVGDTMVGDLALRAESWNMAWQSVQNLGQMRPLIPMGHSPPKQPEVA
jgi:hypothetical protein